MRTTYNPLLRATRLALAELTTPEAQRWYWQQIRNSAVLAQRITLQGVTVARRWVSAIHGQAAVVESVQTDALAQAAAPKQSNAVVEPVQDYALIQDLPDAEASTVDEQQEHEAVEAVAEVADLEPEPAPTAWAATDEAGGAADDEPLIEVEASEEDTSFYEPEDEDAIDGLTLAPEDTAQSQQSCFNTAQQPCFDPAQQPSRLSLLIQEFKRQKAESSAEMVGEDGSAAAVVFAWEDTPAGGDSEAELGHGEDSLALIEVDQGIDLFPTPTTRTAVSTIQVEKSFSVAPENFDSDADAKTGGSDDRKY